MEYLIAKAHTKVTVSTRRAAIAYFAVNSFAVSEVRDVYPLRRNKERLEYESGDGDSNSYLIAVISVPVPGSRKGNYAVTVLVPFSTISQVRVEPSALWMLLFSHHAIEDIRKHTLPLCVTALSVVMGIAVTARRVA